MITQIRPATGALEQAMEVDGRRMEGERRLEGRRAFLYFNIYSM
jgi:hypothetical protein